MAKFLNPVGFIKEHERFYAQLRRYMTTGRGRHNIRFGSFPRGWLRKEAISLPAINDQARVALMKAAVALFQRHSLTVQPPRFFFFTVISRTFAVPLATSEEFMWDRLRELIEPRFANLDYVGVIEAALYSNYELRGHRAPTVSWHAHLLVWNTTEAVMEGLRDAINVEHKTLLPGAEAAHVRRLGRDGARARIVYMLKAPTQDYRVVDDLSFQWKRDLRPGLSLQLLRLMSNLKMSQLLLAGGEGIQFWKTAKAKAVASIMIENAAARRRFRQSYE